MRKITIANMCLEKAKETPKTKKPFYTLCFGTYLIFKAICIHFRRITEQLRSLWERFQKKKTWAMNYEMEQKSSKNNHYKNVT